MGSQRGTTKCRGHKEINDKFYTKESVSKKCIDFLDLSSYDIIVEPSAGGGSFSNQIPNCIAYDLVPENDNIIKQDFLKLNIEQFQGYKVLTIGNPPFGIQNNLAIKFFNKAAEYSDTIAFILPMTFKKSSIQNKLNLHFHLEQEMDLDFNSFELNGNDYGVKCVFQIWKKKKDKRIIKHNDYNDSVISFVKNTDDYDFIVRRVGGNCGKAFLNEENPSKQSNYFIKNNTILSNERIVEIINSTDKQIVDFSVGPRSISKNELIEIMEDDILLEVKRQQKGFDFEKIISKIFRNVTINKKYGDEFDGELRYNNTFSFCQMKHSEDINKNNVELGSLKRNSDKSVDYYLFVGFSDNEETNKINVHFKDCIKVVNVHLNDNLKKLKDIYVYKIPVNAFNIKFDSINEYFENVNNRYTKYMDNIERINDDEIFDIKKYKLNEISTKTLLRVLIKKDELIHYGFFDKEYSLKETFGFVSNESKDGYITFIPVNDNGDVYKNVEDVPDYYNAILKVDHTFLTDYNWKIVSNIIIDKFNKNNTIVNIKNKRDHKNQFRTQCDVNINFIEKYLVKYDENIFEMNNKNILSFDEYKEISLWD